MKNILYLLTFCLIITSCDKPVKAKDSYTINGKAEGIYNGIRVYLKALDNRGKQIDKDTAIVVNGTFKFEGKVESPQLWFVFVDNLQGNKAIIVENADISIEIDKDNLNNSLVTGTEANTAYNQFANKINELTLKRKDLAMEYRQAINKNDTITANKLTAEIAQASNESATYPFEFIKANNKNIFSLKLIESYTEANSTDLDLIIDAYNSLDQSLKDSFLGKKVYTSIMAIKQQNAALENLNIGKVAPKFSAPSVDGNDIALDDILGKVTIIDFWASWCGPCRRENPNVVKTYNKYHDKGLEIISVSLDKPGQKEKWLKAIEDDKLTWHHVSNLNYFNDPVAKLYNIQSIPATYILDADGRIVAKNLRGTALEDKIGELLN